MADQPHLWDSPYKKLAFRISPKQFHPRPFYGIPQVPVGKKRKGTDLTISGSITRWGELTGQRQVLFLDGNRQTGSLYHELFARGGFRR